jgi:hypothetical protein
MAGNGRYFAPNWQGFSRDQNLYRDALSGMK